MLNVDVNEINSTIFEHEDFKSFTKRIENIFQEWCDKHQKKLKNLKAGFNPKELIFELSEDLLSVFSELKLMDKYDLYQHLMEYWSEVMQDDAYILSSDGWKAEVYRILETDKKGKEVDKGWTCDLIPKQLIVDKYFLEEFNAINKLNEELENAIQKMQAINEENSGDDDIFEEVRNDKGNITAGELKKKIKEWKNDPNMQDELVILERYQFFKDEEKRLKNAIKNLEKKLDDELLAKYPTLSTDEIKELVVDNKWFMELHKRVTSELDRVSQKLTSRIKELSLRYEDTMPKLSEKVQELTSKVDSDLQKMGFKW